MGGAYYAILEVGDKRSSYLGVKDDEYNAKTLEFIDDRSKPDTTVC